VIGRARRFGRLIVSLPVEFLLPGLRLGWNDLPVLLLVRRFPLRKQFHAECGLGVEPRAEAGGSARKCNGRSTAGLQKAARHVPISDLKKTGGSPWHVCLQE